MTVLAVTHPTTVGHTIVKTVSGVALLAVTAAGLYAGAGALARHYQQPTPSHVSYATQEQVTRTLTGAWHTPATLGAFRDDASIATPDVVSVVVVVP